MTDPEPDREISVWLRRQRELRGWNTTELARRILRAGRDNGDTNHLPSVRTMLRNVEHWEEERAIPDRYRLHCCAALGIAPASSASRTRNPVTSRPRRPPPRRRYPRSPRRS